MPTEKDVLLFLDSMNIYHAFQPMSALSAQRRAYLMKLNQALWEVAVMTNLDNVETMPRDVMKLQLAMLTTLLPTVNPNELKRLDAKARLEWLQKWDQLQAA